MSTYQTCDGRSRRDFVKAGSLAFGGLSLPLWLQSRGRAQTLGSPGTAKGAIFVDLRGGPSHIDSFDPKPEAPEQIRGSFSTIKTRTPGLLLSEHLPKLANCSDQYAVIRGVSHTLATHDQGQEYIATGTRPIASLDFPAYGSVIAKELPVAKELPPYVAIPRATQGAGFLGIQYAPLNTGSTPREGQSYEVRGISLDSAADVRRLRKRNRLLNQLDTTFDSVKSSDQLVAGMDEFNRKALDIVTSSKARDAFDVSKESRSFAKLFAGDDFSQSCLLAVRLIEAGVRFVTVSLGGWDTHAENFNRLKNDLLPKLDAGLSSLLAGLQQRNLLDETSVLCSGEFGRTPKINNRSNDGGRDHYPRCMFMAMAGGGVRGGQVVGESDREAAAPLHKEYRPDDVAASLYHSLGIDPSHEYHTNTGRPVTLVRDGEVISQLFG